MNATEVRSAAAGVPRRLRRTVCDVVSLLVALVLGFLLWPTSLGGCTTLTIVSGHSMEPTYYTGDLVLSRCGTPAVGDVVVYTPPDAGGARIIHRLIDGDSSGWVIRGDNNDFIDPWRPTDESVLGTAVFHLPKVGLVGTLLVSPATWLSLLLVAAALVLWPSRTRPDDEDEPEDEPTTTAADSSTPTAVWWQP